jgi:STE24 endopeptidase
MMGVKLYLDFLNKRELIKTEEKLPGFLKKDLDNAKLSKIQKYTAENLNLGIYNYLTSHIIWLIFILSPVFLWWADRVVNLQRGDIISAIIFFGVTGLVFSLIELPFSYHQTFTIESKFGFNTQTLITWLIDLIKTLIVQGIIWGALLCFTIWTINRFELWWLYVWLFLFVFLLGLIRLYPVLIAPLFNKFEPIKDKELVEKISHLMGKEGLKIKGVFEMDASRRTKHTNAYFTGLGKSKRIVLFDSLLKSMTHDEIIGILAHEIGHWKKKHVLKNMLLSQILALIWLYLSSIFIKSFLVYDMFSIPYYHKLYIGLFIISILWEPISFFISPLFLTYSRRYEYEADDYAYNLTQNKPVLKSIFVKLAKDNLANLNPHPWYVKFYYSHPPIVDRINNILEK